MRQRLVAGNWKMNGTPESVASLLSELAVLPAIDAEMAVCPPFVFIGAALAALQGSAIRVGGQNLSEHDSGAYTGETEGKMLAAMGCKYVIVGHSERRSLYGETDQLVAAKFIKAQDAGLVPILCIGETLEQREAGQATETVGQQLQAVIDAAGIETLNNAVLAYEPVWAIGTGKTATPEQAQEIHKFLREKLAGQNQQVADKLRILYGGSVKAANAAELFSQPDIDGALVGGASLDAKEFAAIAAA